jgi:hypothetical protein
MQYGRKIILKSPTSCIGSVCSRFIVLENQGRHRAWKIKVIIVILKSNSHVSFFLFDKKILNWPRPLFSSRTDHACHQKPYLSHETFSLSRRSTN